MSKHSRFIVGGKPLPLDLHTIWADEEGKPLSVGNGTLKFDFSYRNIRFAGQYQEDEAVPHGAFLKLVGDCGPMPFSAESPAGRVSLATIAEAANGHLGAANLGPVFRVANGRLLVGREVPMRPPVTSVSLVSTIAGAVIPLVPYLDLIALIVRPPLEPARPGEPALRREWRRQRPR